MLGADNRPVAGFMSVAYWSGNPPGETDPDRRNGWRGRIYQLITITDLRSTDTVN